MASIADSDEVVVLVEEMPRLEKQDPAGNQASVTGSPAITNVDCRICGEVGASSEFRNIGKPKYPNWLCVPCHNAERSLRDETRAKGKDAEAKLLQMKKKDPMGYKRQIISCMGPPWSTCR